MSWFQLDDQEKITKLTDFLQNCVHPVINLLMILWLIVLAGFIGKVVLLHNFVSGWNLADDPVDLWIGLGVIALLWERAFDRMYRKDKDGTTTS